MFRRILPPILVVFTFLLDTAVLPAFSSHWLMPLFALLTVHTMGLLLGRASGALYGMLCGLLVDITVSTPLGLMTVFYAALGYAGGWFAHRMFRRNLLTSVSALVSFSVFELGMALYTTVVGAAFVPELFVRALIRIVEDIALVQMLYIIYDRIIKPDHSVLMRR